MNDLWHGDCYNCWTAGGIHVLLRRLEAFGGIEAAVRVGRRYHGVVGSVVRWDTWRALLDAISTSPSSVVVVDPYFSGALDLEEIRICCALARVSGCLAYADLRGRPAGNDVARLVEAGVRRVVTLGVDDDPRAFGDDLVEMFGLGDLLDVLKRCEPALSSSQQMILRWSIRRGCAPTSVQQMAGELRISQRTLTRWCSDLPGISTRDLLRWGRILHACRLYSHTNMTLGAIAHDLRFSSTSDVRRKFTSLTGGRLSCEVREMALEASTRAIVEIIRSPAPVRVRG